MGIDELKRQVDDIKQEYVTKQELEATNRRVEALELQTEAMFSRFGNYKNRTTEELNLMAAQIGDLLISLDSLVQRIEFEKGAEQAEALRKKLIRRCKYNNTLINKVLETRAAGG